MATPEQTPTMTTDSLTGLYSRSPGSAQVKAPDPIQAAQTTSKGYLAQARDVASGDMSANQLNDITKQDSPLMQRAKQEGMLTAASRGLQNSSIAAGAAQGAMVDKATPLALQDAQTNFTQGRANQDATNTASQFEAEASNQANSQNAALQTDVNKSNAAMQLDASTTNANSENSMRQQVLQQNSELNKQYLAGSQALDLASLQGQYQQLISTNETAANLYGAYFNSISEMMANKDISPERIATTVALQQQMLASGLKFMNALNGLDLSTQVGAATDTGNPTPTGASTTDPDTGVPIQQSAPMVEVGQASLPGDTTTKQTRPGYFDVFNGQGTLIGHLQPGGKKGKYVPL